MEKVYTPKNYKNDKMTIGKSYSVTEEGVWYRLKNDNGGNQMVAQIHFESKS